MLSEGIQELGVTEVEELLLDWLDPFLTVKEQDRLLGWHLGVKLQNPGRAALLNTCDQYHRQG